MDFVCFCRHSFDDSRVAFASAGPFFSLIIPQLLALARSKLLLAIDSIVGGGEKFMEFMASGKRGREGALIKSRLACQGM